MTKVIFGICVFVSAMVSVYAADKSGALSFDPLNGKPYQTDSVGKHTVNTYVVEDLAFDELNGKPYKVFQKFTLTCDGAVCVVTKG